SWNPDDRLSPVELVAGRAPAADNDVVLDRASAKKGGFRVGDAVTILTPDRHQLRVSGIATFGGRDSSGIGLVFVTLPVAERMFTAPGKVDAVVVRGESGVSQNALASRIATVV